MLANFETEAERCGWWMAVLTSCLVGCADGSADDEAADGTTGESSASSGESGGEEVDNEVDGEFPAPLAEGLAPTPPMGWNSWNHFGCSNSESLITRIADAMVDSGMAAAGYEYLNLDDCWHEAERGEGGLPTPTGAYPNGMAPVVDYVHDLGLKMGIYSDRGETTCARRHGSRGFVDVDVQTWADWGIDYLKYDNCDYIADDSLEHNLDETLMEEEFRLMSDALRSSDRDIVFSVCAWQFYEWAMPLGELWRTTADITDTWSSIVTNIGINGAPGQAAYAGPNQWNDPDMMQVGRFGMTETEYRAHFGMWAIMAAPLLAGNDLSNMREETIDILTNEEVIAVNQDALGYQAVRIKSEGAGADERSVWTKPLNEHGARAVALLNFSDTAQDISVDVADLALRDTEVSVRDLWTHEDLDAVRGEVSARVPAHGVAMLKVVGDEPLYPRGEVDVGDLTWIHADNRTGPIERDLAVGGAAEGDGESISIGGEAFEKGLGVAAPAMAVYRLGANCSRFTATVGLDDQGNGGSVQFEVWGDHERLYQGEVLTEDSTEEIDVDVDGVYRLKLRVLNGLDGTANDFASFGDPRLICDE